jgi:hypothetical protein
MPIRTMLTSRVLVTGVGVRTDGLSSSSVANLSNFGNERVCQMALVGGYHASEQLL